MTLSVQVKSMVGDNQVLANSIANYASPASGEKFTGLCDTQTIEVCALKDSTKFQFGSGLALPGYEKWNESSGIAIPNTTIPVMAAGTTWSLIVVLYPFFSGHGFWRMEYTGLDGRANTRIGVLPTANAIIREQVVYMYGYTSTSDTNANQLIGTVVETKAGDLGSLSGRLRMPAISATSHLDAPDLANQGMSASSLMGMSFDVNGSSPVVADKDDSGYLTLFPDLIRPYVSWTGPKLGSRANISAIVQTMANDPTRFVEKPLKEDGSYDIARSADLHWHPGILHTIENPLWNGAMKVQVADEEFEPRTVLCSGIPDISVAPMLLAFTGVSQQANLNMRTNNLMEIEPEIGSAFMPFRGLPPSGGASATAFLKAFCGIAAPLAHTFTASMNDTGELSHAVKSMISDTKRSQAPVGGQSGAWGTADKAVSGFFANGKDRNARKTSVRTNKQDNKTSRKANKQATKQARIAAKKR